MKQGFDLLRGAGTTAAAKRKAIIPDPRNDENLAVAQTHLAMIRFHNRVVDTLPSSVPVGMRFATAREIVTKHYQWMIRTDYLPRVCAAGVVSNVFTSGRKAFEVGVTPTDVPTMPIEFSVAAFRLGHSMIRRAYNWNKVFDDGFGTLDFLFTFSAGSGNLGNLPRLPSSWIADFRRLYDFGEAPGKPALVVPAAKFNRAMRIDTLLVPPLRTLPGFPADEANLAFRNLTRARMVRLATGQQMVTFLKSKGVNVTKLTNRRSATARTARSWTRSPRHSAPRSSRTRRSGSTSCARPSSTGASSKESARGSSRRPSTGPWRGARSRSSAIPPGRRRSVRTARRSGWPTCCSSRSKGRRRCSRRSASRVRGRLVRRPGRASTAPAGPCPAARARPPP